ncbi:MAG TPA: NAD-dependent epimerase/dehydratase family protein [Kofleriaceae bacterium]|nr:NAD-dependent epimerase/dehydratase family protein [Kofleriaceae bacterium]
MHIVVTGAAGFIGSHTCEALVAAGHRVTGVDVFDSYLYPAAVKRRNAAAALAPLPRESFQLVEVDICDEAAMDALLAGQDVDVVCHLAALAGVRPSIAEPLRYVRANLTGTTVILEAMRRGSCRRIVFASSSSVYGARGGADLAQVAAFREDDPCLSPASPYAATKRAGELLLSTYRDLHGIGASCLRFFTVYGPRQRPDMAIHKFVRAIAAGWPIDFYGDGESRRDYSYVADVVRGVVAACERARPGAHAIYNLGGTATTSLARLVAIIEEVVGRSALLDRQPDQPGDVPITFADITGAARDLDYAPATRIEDGVREFWRWVQEEERVGRPIA